MSVPNYWRIALDTNPPVFRGSIRFDGDSSRPGRWNGQQYWLCSKRQIRMEAPRPSDGVTIRVGSRYPDISRRFEIEGKHPGVASPLFEGEHSLGGSSVFVG